MLVAISIPIFTAQLKKARLATNQANARAAYAAAVAAQLDKDATSEATNYTYTVKTAKLEAGSTAGTIETPITDWKVDTVVGVKLGDVVADTWNITIQQDVAPKFLGAASE